MGTPGLGINPKMVVHGSQRLRIHRPLMAGATFVAVNRILELVDKGASGGAIIVTERTLHDKASGALLASMEAAAREFPGKATLRGVLPTMVDLREPVTMEILDDLRKNLGDRLLQSVILRDTALVEASSFGQSVFQHSPQSKAARCYADLVKELEHG
jgi:cellulose biosynthesis protein BcsQ